jgi:hypothetical protein
VPSLTSRWATGVVDWCFSFSTRGSMKVGSCMTAARRSVISWRSNPTGRTDSDKPQSDKPDSIATELRRTSAGSCPSAFQCAISSCGMPYATSLCRSGSILYHRTKHLPSANPTDPKQQSMNLPEISRTYGRPCEKSFNDLPSQSIWLEMMLMNMIQAFLIFDTHSLVDNGRNYKVSLGPP